MLETFSFTVISIVKQPHEKDVYANLSVFFEGARVLV